MNIKINGLFSPDNMFFRFMGRISDLMILNFLWIICSIPVVTIGASTTALYNMTLKLVDENEGYLFKDFFRCFRENFKKATVIWLGLLSAFCIISVNLAFWIHFKSIGGYISESIMVFVTLVFLLMNIYVFPILSSFNESVKDTVKKACILSLKYLPYSMVILFISLAAAGVLLIFPFTVLFMIFLGVAFLAYINSFLIKRVFGKCFVYLQES